jgi:ABC transport system ATP-binding/permease protein
MDDSAASNALFPAATASLAWAEDGVQKEQVVPPEGLTIGRSADNSLAINDLAASRYHCKVLPDAGGYAVVDLDSRNGTFVNGARITGANPLQHGDRIRIGKLEFQVSIIEVQPAGETMHGASEELPLGQTMIYSADQDQPWLMVSSGPGQGGMFTLSRPRMQIGRASRDKKWDVDLIDKSVSRPHAEIVQEKDGWVLKDLGSANGTLVNGKLIKDPHPLKNGDVLGIGDTILIFRAKGGE